MKCLETEKLISYAYRLIDEAAASEVRAHLGECSHCREIVEEHGRLDFLLDEWKAAEPTPEFDVRVRQAVEARQAGRLAWGFWNWGWARGLALAALGVLVIAGVIWVTQTHRRVSNCAGVATLAPHPASGAPTPAQVASLHASAARANTGVGPAKHAPGLGSAGVLSAEDKDAQALEDYDLAANFYVLSELPKGDSRVAD